MRTAAALLISGAAVPAALGRRTPRQLDSAEREHWLDYNISDAGLHHADILGDGVEGMPDRISTGLVAPCSHRNEMPVIDDGVFDTGLSAEDIENLRHDVRRIDKLESYFKEYTERSTGAAGPTYRAVSAQFDFAAIFAPHVWTYIAAVNALVDSDPGMRGRNTGLQFNAFVVRGKQTAFGAHVGKYGRLSGSTPVTPFRSPTLHSSFWCSLQHHNASTNPFILYAGVESSSPSVRYCYDAIKARAAEDGAIPQRHLDLVEKAYSIWTSFTASLLQRRYVNQYIFAVYLYAKYHGSTQNPRARFYDLEPGNAIRFNNYHAHGSSIKLPGDDGDRFIVDARVWGPQDTTHAGDCSALGQWFAEVPNVGFGRFCGRGLPLWPLQIERRFEWYATMEKDAMGVCMLRGLGYEDRADFYRTIYAGECDETCLNMPLPVVFTDIELGYAGTYQGRRVDLVSKPELLRRHFDRIRARITDERIVFDEQRFETCMAEAKDIWDFLYEDWPHLLCATALILAASATLLALAYVTLTFAARAVGIPRAGHVAIRNHGKSKKAKTL